jgi:(1->4)-alpha-D-glucan 1-alpha-D-glucosylmutase
VLWRALAFREQHRELFDSGRYVPLAPVGEKREHVCAFARVQDKRAAVVVAPRLVHGLTAGAEQPPIGDTAWQDTFLILPEARDGAVYRNAFTDEELVVEERGAEAGFPLSKALSVCPVALLQRVR